MIKDGNKMNDNHQEKELFYPDGTLMYRGGVKKMILVMIYTMARGRFLIKKVNDYSKVNLLTI